MSHASSRREKAVPAQLRFLAIYNPSLGRTDETRHDQVVYHFPNKRRKSAGKDTSEGLKAEENERLRHIGLAQGMVEFGKVFSQGKSVDAIETEKSRTILHELEPGWWILASIDLTRLAKVSKPLGAKDDTTEKATIEYSSREVKPPVLLLQDLLRAHSIFLLHHTSSISALFTENRRSKFTYVLGRYWDKFLSTWNVMLHGNPAISVFSGIKVAGSGELGMGVGEEDRGSGEREVLEGFVGRIDGLVDLVVSRFGAISVDADRSKVADQCQAQSHLTRDEPWLGTGSEPGSNDGAIFLGVGALSKNSLRDVTHWMEDIYSWGPHAYGVYGNLARTRRPHRKSRLPTKSGDNGSMKSYSTQAAKANSFPSTTYTSLAKLNDTEGNSNSSRKQTISPILDELDIKTGVEIVGPRPVVETNFGENERQSSSRRTRSTSSSRSSRAGGFVDYLKLGYGTHWSLGGGTAKPLDTSTPSDTISVNAPPGSKTILENVTSKTTESEESWLGLGRPCYPTDDSRGHYLVGLVGDVEAEVPENSSSEIIGVDLISPRILFRTVTVELSPERNTLSDANPGINSNTADDEALPAKNGLLHLDTFASSPSDSRDRVKKELRVVVYAIKPFLFTLLFDVSTDSLSEPSVYRSLHYQLAPLQRPLSTSTQLKLPRPTLSTTLATDAKTPIYDLIWDHNQLTICSTVPDIPAPSTPVTSPPVWPRLEALNTHTQILNMFAATRNKNSELEQTCKTSRGYWVVWSRIPDPEVAQNQRPMTQGTVTPVGSNATTDTESLPSHAHMGEGGSDTDRSLLQERYTFKQTDTVKGKEIFLVRKSSDPTTANTFARDNTNTPAKLAQGIGVDTKRYIEGLLDMYR